MPTDITVPPVRFDRRLARFLAKPWRQKAETIGFLCKRAWLRVLPGVPLPVRLPWGVWWLASNDVAGGFILFGDFESTERRIFAQLAQPGMTVLDLGAHHGFYTLLASRKVGHRGRVIAFEPSPRERKKLRLHLRLNFCRNVVVEPCAVGESDGETEFFLVDGRQTGCNSLRPPDVDEGLKKLRVPVTRLDRALERLGIETADLLKMDVEGGELGALRGAARLLSRPPRPVILCEVQDIRTRPWGYPAKEILSFLSERGYSWFEPQDNGGLRPFTIASQELDGNYVAVPAERLEQIRAFLST